MHPPLPEIARADSAAPSDVYRVVRGDSIEPSKIRRTPWGGAVIPACLGRPGVLIYQDADGSTVREWRPSSEVLDPAALAQLSDAPVTREHPAAGLVTPENVGAERRGNVSAGTVRVEGGLPWADLAIDPGPLLEDILAGRKTGLSLGYVCRLDATPGIVPAGELDAGQSYDRRQVGPTKNNHVAVVANPRAGAVASLRLDSAGNVCTLPVESTISESARMDPIVIDGITYPRTTPAEIAAAFAALARVAEKVRTDSATVTAETATLRAKLATAEKTIAEHAARFDADVAGMVAELVKATLAAKRVLGADYDAAGKGLAEIQADVLGKAYPKMDLKGRSPEVLSALMEACEGGAGEPDGDETEIAADAVDVGDAVDVTEEPGALAMGTDAMPAKPVSTAPGGPPAVKTDSTGRNGLGNLQAARLNGGGRVTRTDALTSERDAMIARDRQRGLEPLPSAR